MGGYAHTNVGDATLITQYPSFKQMQNHAGCHVETTGGTANAQTITLSPAITAYANGQLFTAVCSLANTGSMTLAVNGLSAITVFDSKTGIALIGNEISQFMRAEFLYSNGNFFLMNGRPGRATWTPNPTGFAVAPSNTAHEYWRNGNIVTAIFRAGVNGTSNLGSWTCSAPVAAATLTNGAWCCPLTYAYDNGALIYTAAANIVSGSSTISVDAVSTGAGWTAGGAKGGQFTLTYPTS